MAWTQYSQSNSITMKFLLVALAAVATVSATKDAAVTCDECQAAAADLVTHLLGEESLAEQIAILKLVVCPQVSLFFLSETSVYESLWL